MKKNSPSMSRRSFLNDLMKNVVHTGLEFKKNYDEGRRITEVFSSFETSYPLSRHYPRELFEEEAERLGIDIDKVGIDRAVELIMMAGDSHRPRKLPWI